MSKLNKKLCIKINNVVKKIDLYSSKEELNLLDGEKCGIIKLNIAGSDTVAYYKLKDINKKIK